MMLDFFSSNDPIKIVERSNKLRIEGKYDKAEQLLKKNIKNSKSDFIILLELARAQFEQEKIQDSIISLRSAYLSSPEDVAKVITIAEDLHYKTQNKGITASILFELFIKKRDFDNFHKIFSSLGNADIPIAISAFEKPFQNIKETKTIEQLTKKDIETYLTIGTLYINNKQFKEAKSILEIIFKTQPKDRDNILSEYLTVAKGTYGNPAPYMAIGDLYVIINDKDKAINYYQKAVNIDPSLKEFVAKKFEESLKDTSDISESSKFSVVDLYINKNDFQKAIDILREIMAEKQGINDDISRRAYQIIQAKSDFVEGFKLLSEVLIFKKDINSAVINLNKIFELTNSENVYIIKTIDRMISQNLINEDLLVLKTKILVNSGDFAESSRLVEKIYEMNKAYAFELEQLLNEILSKDSLNLHALSAMSMMFVDRDQIDKAKQILEYISSQDSADYKAIAYRDYVKLYEKFGDDIEIKEHLSIVLIELGKIREAESIIFETIKIQPDLFYEIIPKLYKPAKKSREIADHILKILNSIDSSKLDPFLFNYSYAEIMHLAGQIEQSLALVLELIGKYPDKEDELLSLIERMKSGNSDNDKISEFEFKYYLEKKDYTKSLDSLLQLYNNKQMMGHVLDNLYLIYKQNPNDIRIITNIMKIHDEMGLYEKIIQESSEFVSKTSQQNSGIVKFYIGKAYAMKGMLNDSATFLFQAMALDDKILDESIKILLDLLKIDFYSLRVHYTLAHGYYRKKLIDDAIDELMEVIKIDEKQIDLVIKDIETWYEYTKRNAKLTFVLGKMYLEKGLYDKAISKVKETYEMENQYIDDILTLLKSTIEHDVENGEILFTIGMFYAKKGLFKIASDYLYNAMSIETSLKESVISQLQLIISQQPEEIDARFSMAQVYKDMHNYLPAIALLRQIEMINPNETENVVNYYLEMLSIEPNNSHLLFSIADSYLRTQMIAEALEIFRKVISLNKRQADEIIDKLIDYENKTSEIQLFLSELYIEKEDYENAVNWLNIIYITDITKFESIMDKLNRILEMSPRQQNAIMLLSMIYYDSGKYDRLIELTYEIFEKSNVEEQKFRFGVLLAQAYKSLGQSSKSEDVINKMKSLNINLFYAIIYQIYEQEKSKKAQKLKSKYDQNPQDDANTLDYATCLIGQHNNEEAREILKNGFKNEDSSFERIYILSKSYETSGNIIFALELASQLRISKKASHVAHLIKLMKKLGYYGEIESILRERRELSFELSKFKYAQNVFADYKIIA